MSGKIGDNLGTASGLVKSATDAPDSGSSDPGTDENPSAVGDRFINTTSGELFVCTDATTDDNVWKGQLGTTVSEPKFFGGRGVFMAGESNVIDYITIANTGDATDFGDLANHRSQAGAEGVSNGSRGVNAGGAFSPSGTNANVIEYITFSSVGNATDFGDLTIARYLGPAGVSSGTRGCFGGAYTTGATDIIDYITIASAGDATDFGDLTAARNNPSGCSNGTRGIWSAGSGGSNVIDYITIANTGDATDFGDVVSGREACASSSNGTRGVIAGGYSSPARTDVIEYVTIASAGNTSDFGDLTVASSHTGACSDGTKGVWAGGNAVNQDKIEYVNIASIGDATDFGNLTAGRGSQPSGVSGD